MEKLANISQFESLQSGRVESVRVDNGFWDFVTAPVKLPFTALKKLGSVLRGSVDPNFYRSIGLDLLKFQQDMKIRYDVLNHIRTTLNKIVVAPEATIEHLPKMILDELPEQCDVGIEALKQVKSMIRQYRYWQARHKKKD